MLTFVAGFTKISQCAFWSINELELLFCHLFKDFTVAWKLDICKNGHSSIKSSSYGKKVVERDAKPIHVD